jgi:U3 small nucleolar ribonucleoprotein protein LCP5
VLEKVKVLEGRMRYQIEKLVRLSKEDDTSKDAMNGEYLKFLFTHCADHNLVDPLAFRPNPLNLLNTGADEEGDEDPDDTGARPSKRKDKYIPTDDGDGLYRPPRVAPTPYIPPTKGNAKARRAAAVPTSLAALLHSDPSQPYLETTSGLGGNADGSLSTSSRARYLKHLTEFEEGQFGRVMMGKKEEKRRRRDEGVLAIGGGLSGIGEDGANGKRGRTAGGLEDEFMDVLRDSGRSSRMGDGYEEPFSSAVGNGQWRAMTTTTLTESRENEVDLRWRGKVLKRGNTESNSAQYVKYLNKWEFRGFWTRRSSHDPFLLLQVTT